jgi:hypothetical protein
MSKKCSSTQGSLELAHYDSMSFAKKHILIIFKIKIVTHVNKEIT